MNWVQDQCMMLSSQAPPQGGVSSSGPHPPALHRLPPTSPALPPTSPQIAYEGRVSLLSNSGTGEAWPHPPHFQQFNSLNFNLIHNPFSRKESDLGYGLEQDRETSPSSAGSPRTDETIDKSSDKLDRSNDILEKSFDTKPDQGRTEEEKTSLDILKEHIRAQLPNPPTEEDDVEGRSPDERSSPGEEENLVVPPSLSIRRDIQEEGRSEDLRNISEEKGEEFEEEEEELRIDEEMEEEERDLDQFETLDKSVEKLNPFVGFQPYLALKNEEDGLNSLEKLQQVLNNRMFSPRDRTVEQIRAEPNGNGNHVDENGEFRFILPPDEEGMVYQCHLCSFTATTRIQFNAHVNSHYTFQCVKCDFEDKSESIYVRHLKEEHNCTPEDLEEAEVRVPRVNSQGKVKTFKCKQCEFVAVTKIEFWKHGRGHIKPEKLLCCPKCIFVTEYKHHLEYHLRNHYGTKPFKCTHCNYSCVNKSMLNSHMKSHTNVYQYRCADCTYATKYCHSLKLHLRKYGHKPAMVLNNDGSPNPLPAMEMFGGKRPKGRKEDMYPPTMLPQFPSIPPNFMQMQLQHLQNQFGHPKMPQPPPQFHLEDPGKYAQKLGEASNGNHSPTFMGGDEQMGCDKCEFSTSSKEVFRNHLMLHASSERSALHHLLTSPLQHGKRSFSDLNKSGEDFSYSPRIRSRSPSSPSSSFGMRSIDKSDSPTSTSSFPPHLSYFNKLAMSSPLLQGLVPNPAIRALMEERHKEALREERHKESMRTTPDSMRDSLRDTPESPLSREGAPLPPNKRHKSDIFSALYASRMNEIEKAESPNGALDLSKETVIGGGSHGSSSDVDTGSNPRSHSSSPALSSNSKNRRKGKAFKIERRTDRDSEEECVSSAMPSLVPIPRSAHEDPFQNSTACKFCGIAFQNSVMFRMHMDYHGFEDPFKCSHCGEEAVDALAFFLHIARREHV